MNDPIVLELAPPRPDALDLTGEITRTILRLADLIEPIDSADLSNAGSFLRALADHYDSAAVVDSESPLQRLSTAFDFTRLDLDLLILAGLAEEHEGLAGVLARLHPGGEPVASVGLAAQLIGDEGLGRQALRTTLERGAAVAAGAVAMGSGKSLFNRSLHVAPRLWPVLHGVDAWPERAHVIDTPVVNAGLQEWLDSPACRPALAALRQRERCLCLLTGEDVAGSAARAAVLVEHSGASAVRFGVDCGSTSADGIAAHVAARGVIPIISLPDDPHATPALLHALAGLPGPFVACARPGQWRPTDGRPVLQVEVTALSGRAREAAWRVVLPELARQAARLAAAYTLEPDQAAQVALDARTIARIERRRIGLDDVKASVRARTHAASGAAVSLRRPTASWDALIVPPDHRAQLEEAVQRLHAQRRVLEEWGFLQGRPGARGVRLLLSGPPGTGKTLAAEVLAHALGVDLLVVDVARLVSKWLGETEKHLAHVFDTAERTQAVLLFDEADALFGRRTEVSDANDRYANLETAYLLSRLERFEGLAVLATNLKRNLDTAFLRRLEFVVELDEPDLHDRHLLWRHHMSPAAPLDDAVDLHELAALYPLTGALIRNAAVAAAFVAASRGLPITREVLVHTIRREYHKAGRAFPGLPSGMIERKETPCP